MFLKHWRQTLFMSLALNKVAVPFSNTMRMKSAFKAMKTFTQKSRNAKQFYKDHVQRKVLMTFYQHSKLQSRLNFMLRQRQTKQVSDMLEALAHNATYRIRLKRAQNEIEEKVAERMKLVYLSHWA